MNYIPLRVKTSYSFLKSLNDIKKMVSYCKEKGIEACAICDCNMFGVMEFYKECIKNDIKPIIGLELTIDNGFVILYAKNYAGYQNLTRITYAMQDTPISLDILRKYCSDLICVTNLSIDFYDDIYYGYTNSKDRDLNKKCVYVPEILCLEKDDIKYLKYLDLIKKNKKLKDKEPFLIHSNCYFDFNSIDYENAYEIASKCNITFEVNKNLFPKYECKNAKEYLFNLAKNGLFKRFDGKVTKKYYDRLLYELDVIDKNNFNDYFLVVFDYVRYAKKSGILVGPGRGSAASSLVAYSLGITDVDPIKYNLLFERFLNTQRITLPDIDIDFEANRRDEVVKYVMEKYGYNRTVGIITFTTLASKQVLRDVARVYDIDTHTIDRLVKYVHNNYSLDTCLSNKNLLLYLKENPKIDEIYRVAMKLEGLKRQYSIHAAGIIIGGDILSNYIPIIKYGNFYISGYSMEHLEELGLVKMDFLSLKNLDTILSITKKIPNVNLKEIDLNDKKTLSIYTNALTGGIFQFESYGMKQFLSKLRPTTFDDIVAAIALFRPGCASSIDTFIRRKNGLEKIDYIDPSLKDILESTYGIIVYQEQIMQIANVMAGYSYGEADVLRRAMSKKKKEVMEGERDKFINRSIERGYSYETAFKTYYFILKFANYGFNKAHSVAYSILSMMMAYLKAYYKEEFMSAILNSSIGIEDKTMEYVSECRKLDVNILKPSINISDVEYKKYRNSIIVPLSIIKNVGTLSAKEIIRKRESGEFKNFNDFVRRCYSNNINKKVIESLIDADCFSMFEYNHSTLHYNLDAVINYAMISKEIDDELISEPILEVKEEFDKSELLEREKNVFGFYLVNHPVTKYKCNYNNVVNSSDIAAYFDKYINVIGMIDTIKIVETKKLETMAFISLQDEFGVMQVTIFPKEYPKIKNINKNDIVFINGKVQKRMNSYQVILQNIKKL